MTFVKELKKFYPEFDSANLTKEKIYKNTYPGKPFKETVINTMASGLYALAENFLIYESFGKNFFKSPILLREFSIKKMDSEVTGLINRIVKDFRQEETIKENYYDKQETYVEIINHLTRNDDRSRLPEYILKSFNFGFYFWMHRTLTLRNFLFINRNFMDDFKNNIIDKALKAIDISKLAELFEETDEENALVFLLSYYNYMADISHDNSGYFFKLKKLFEKYESRMIPNLMKIFVVSLSNICLKNITCGLDEFYTEFENIYTDTLKNKLYTISDTNNYFNKRLFRAIINTSVYLNKIGWAEEFLKKYINIVDPQFKEQLMHYGNANIEFARKNYDKALYHATKIEQKQIIYKIDTKNLISRIYFETNSLEPLGSMLDSYKHLIKNSNLQDKIYETSHINFIKIIQGIIKIIHDNSYKTELYLLKQKTERTSPINNKSWLLGKITNLE